MKEKFDFDTAGRNTPYRTPDGFFEELTRRTVAEALRRRARRKRRLAWRWTTVVGAAACVAVTLWVTSPERLQTLPDPAEGATQLVRTITHPSTSVSSVAATEVSAPAPEVTPTAPRRATATAHVSSPDPLLEHLTDEELDEWIDMAQSDPFLTTEDNIDEP